MINYSSKNDIKREFVSTLENIIPGLNRIFNSSEKQFIRISEELQQFYRDSKDVAEKGLKVIELLTSTEYQSGIQNFSSIFNNILDHVKDTKKNIDDTESFLDNISTLLNSASDEVSGFNKIFRHLEMQSISIKIESARLGGNDKGFIILADDIHKLARLISNQSNGFNKKAKVLLNTAKDVKTQVAILKKYEDEHSKNILQSVTSSLEALNEKYRLSISNSEDIHARIAHIQKKTASMVTEVQFHDITRQQMEHISNVIKELIPKIKNDESEETDRDLYTYVYKVAKLQSAQLQNSKKELFSAVNNITADLDKISTDITGINSDILMLLKDAGNSCSTFIEKINTELNNILISLTKSEDVRNKFSGSIENVASTIGMLSDFIDEINKISSEVELLSLNSSIKAAHTGKEGAGLGVLAEAIQKLSSDSNKQTISVIKILTQTTGLSENLHSLTRKDSNAVSLKTSTEEINKNFSLVKNIMCNVFGGLTSIEESTAKLKGKLDLSLGSFKEYLTEQKQLEKIISDLAGISATCEVFIDSTVLNELKLDGISRNYTMQVQRDIHNSVYSKTNKPLLNINSEDVRNTEASEFGDNVELF